MREPHGSGSKRQGAVHHCSVIPHHEITQTPGVAQSELRLSRPGQEPIEQGASLLGWPADDLGDGGAEQQ